MPTVRKCKFAPSDISFPLSQCREAVAESDGRLHAQNQTPSALSAELRCDCGFALGHQELLQAVLEVRQRSN